jgi:hypothetical protein
MLEFRRSDALGDWDGVPTERPALGHRVVAVAASVLHDGAGAFGRGTQTQLVQRIA